MMTGVVCVLAAVLSAGQLAAHSGHFRTFKNEVDILRSDFRSEADLLRQEMKNVTTQLAKDMLQYKMSRRQKSSRGLNNKIIDGWLIYLVRFASSVDKRITSLGTARELRDDKIETWMGEIEERLEKLENITKRRHRSKKRNRTESVKKDIPRDCHEVYLQGGLKFEGDYQILIKPDGAPAPFKAVCRVFNNWGWTVIQRRQDGSVDFYRSWADYKVGFGDKHKEFWLGNDNLHYLTTQGDTMLLIEMQDWDGKKYVANYDHFRVDNETKLYRLHVSGYHGNAGDSLTSHWENHDGMAFSTKDKDNDGRYYDSCAHHYHGAWWFNNCFDSHLNGKYYTKGFHRNYFQRDGIQWNSIHQYSSLKQVEMMLKPAEQPKPTAKISNDV
ncbi:LOW QUALITY PROTEIN: fibrinogen-like protein 1 [Haliotis rubra]|uniref:LOW QUALITY PROTEIN: fibrinogen-like protein 1 n=1 Tax=Haliotis rubra TaxID=36100 RepID=UPI001EE4F856|nr:LOW QUALITY PROTEIN: fibrinogen-like protein 1 [Haliotis rubra]